MDSTTITVPTFGTTRDGIVHFFGTRHEPLLENLQQGLGPHRAVVSVKQVHGTDVLVIDQPIQSGQGDDPGTAGGWDALMTNQPGVLLTIRTADCLPVLIHDRDRGVVAAVHAGWRGAVAGIVPKTLAEMARKFGSDVRGVRIGLGPSISSCCYEIDEPVLERLRVAGGDWQRAIQDRAGGKAMLDLRVLVQAQAEAQGVPSEAIHRVSLCTFCHPELFYSYRRQGKADRTMVSGIMLMASGAARKKPLRRR